MSVAFINGVKASGFGNSLLLPAYSPAGNNLLVLIVGVSAKTTSAPVQLSMPSVTDSARNGWETIGCSPCSEAPYTTGGDSAWQLFAFYVRRCSGQTAIVNVSIPGDAVAICAMLQEYSGINGQSCLDNFLMNESVITSMVLTVGTGSIQTSQPGDLLVSAAFDNGNDSGTAHTFTSSAGYTARQALSDGPNSLNLATFDNISGAIGLYANTITPSGTCDGCHCLLIAFTPAKIANPILQVASSFGTPDGANAGIGVAPFPRPNTSGNSIVVLVWGASYSPPEDTVGNHYALIATFGGFYLYEAVHGLGGPNIVMVSGLTGIGGYQTGFVALETYPATYSASNFGSVSPGVRANTGDISVVQGDLILTVGLASGSGINSTQQERVGALDGTDKQIVQFSGLGGGTAAPWGGSMWYYVFPYAPASYGSGIEVTSAIDLTAAIIGFHIAYPPAGAPTNSLLVWDNSYNRFRNQSYSATPLFLEEDTNLLLMATAESGGYAIRYLDYIDYNDGGWSAGQLVQQAIDVTIELPYEDLKQPHFPKQWNMVEVDANTRGQDMTAILNFDDGIAPLTIGTINTSSRQKVQLAVNAGFGVESYKCSPQLQISVLVAPIIYQINVYAATLAANRNTFDTYWIKFGSDESKLVKEGYFDYTSLSPITVALYADGSTTPYYIFTLPTNEQRSTVPERVRFPAIKCRQWRCVATSSLEFQLWNNPLVRVKACLIGSGYANAELKSL